jgi:hypothetical protein
MHEMINKQDVIGHIWRDLIRMGAHVDRSHCGRYIVIDHGPASYYDDLNFMIREWRRYAAWFKAERA